MYMYKYIVVHNNDLIALMTIEPGSCFYGINNIV